MNTTDGDSDKLKLQPQYKTWKQIEREILLRLYHHFGGSLARMSAILEVPWFTLAHKLRKHGLYTESAPPRGTRIEIAPGAAIDLTKPMEVKLISTKGTEIDADNCFLKGAFQFLGVPYHPGIFWQTNDPQILLNDAREAWRRQIKLHHPDKGGGAEFAGKLNRAWELIKKHCVRHGAVLHE